jgi:hypothetical protein
MWALRRGDRHCLDQDAAHRGPRLFERWLVPVSAAIVALVRLASLSRFRPKAVVRADTRAGGVA